MDKYFSVKYVDFILHPHWIINYISIPISKNLLVCFSSSLVIFLRTNHFSSKFNIDQPVESDDDDSINIYSKVTNPILFENDEGMSDDDQVSLHTQ